MPRVFVVYVRSGLAGSDRDEIILLWYRILRKAGIVKLGGLRKGGRDYKDGCAKADRVVGERSSCLTCPFDKCLYEIKEGGENDSGELNCRV